jgi:hypothetical protein
MDPHLSQLPSLDLLPGSTGLAQPLPAQPAIPHVRPTEGVEIGVPAGLTVVDAARIAEAMSACLADSTRTIYAGAWQRWERWRAARDIAAMPAHPAAICAYLTDRAATGLSIGALDTDCSASLREDLLVDVAKLLDDGIAGATAHPRLKPPTVSGRRDRQRVQLPPLFRAARPW